MVRFKQRYMLVEIVFEDGLVDDSLNDREIHEALKDAVQLMHGDYGVACIRRAFKVKYLNSVTNIAVIRCGQDSFRLVWSAMTFIRSIKNRPCFFTVLNLAGSLKKCIRFLVKHNIKEIRNVYAESPKDVKRKLIDSVTLAFEGESSLSPYGTRSKRMKLSDV